MYSSITYLYLLVLQLYPSIPVHRFQVHFDFQLLESLLVRGKYFNCAVCCEICKTEDEIQFIRQRSFSLCYFYPPAGGHYGARYIVIIKRVTIYASLALSPNSLNAHSSFSSSSTSILPPPHALCRRARRQRVSCRSCRKRMNEHQERAEENRGSCGCHSRSLL